MPELLSSDECADILATLERNRDKFIDVSVDTLIATQKFLTINGSELEEMVPIVPRLTQDLCAFVSSLEGRPMAPLENKNVGLSLNLTPPGGVLSWHYDRNLVTCVVHLNEVNGGEFEVYPRYRVRVRDNHTGVRRTLQRLFDAAMRPEPVRRLLGRKEIIRPRIGQAIVMNSTCLHQVASVSGTTSRGAIIFCFDEVGKVFSKEDTKNYYGYRDQRVDIYG
jgi:hypothetical protein